LTAVSRIQPLQKRASDQSNDVYIKQARPGISLLRDLARKESAGDLQRPFSAVVHHNDPLNKKNVAFEDMQREDSVVEIDEGGDELEFENAMDLRKRHHPQFPKVGGA